MKNLKYIAAVGLFSIVQVSCFHRFYKTNTEYQADKAKIEKLVAQKKYFVLHTQDSIVMLVNPIVTDENLKTGFAVLPASYRKDVSPKIDTANRLTKGNSAFALSQVHLYTNNKLNTVGASGTIPYSDITRLDVYGLDKGATSGSTIVSIFGIVLGVAALLFIILVPIGGFTL